MFGIQTLLRFFLEKLYYYHMDYVDIIIALRQDRDLKQSDIARCLIVQGLLMLILKIKDINLMWMI